MNEPVAQAAEAPTAPRSTIGGATVADGHRYGICDRTGSGTPIASDRLSA
jgi:hypothetical protein